MPKILIIDDEAAIRKALKEILEYESYEVEEAEEAVKAYLAKQADFVDETNVTVLDDAQELALGELAVRLEPRQ